MSEISFNKVLNFQSVISFPEDYLPFISAHEQVQFTVKSMRDTAIFTDKRIIIIDVQGITGKKTEIQSVPYKSIVTYSIENAGTFDLDAEIKLLLSGGVFMELKFIKGSEMRQAMNRAYCLISDYLVR